MTSDELARFEFDPEFMIVYKYNTPKNQVFSEFTREKEIGN